MPTPDEQAMMMEMIDRHEQPAGPVQGNFADPEQALVGLLSRQFNIPAEEIMAMPPEEGLTLRQRLERLQPQTTIGGVNVGLNGSVKEPRIEVSGRF